VLSAGLVAAALAAAALTAAADTKSYSYRVELAATAAKSQVRAGNVDWACRGKYCVASARGGNVSVRGCRELASQVGRVVSYRSEIKKLDADDIDACNATSASEKSSPKRATAAAASSTAASPTASSPTASSPSAARPTAATKPPAGPSRVTTEELTFTGVHNWSPAR